MLISRVSGSGEVCGRAPRAIIGATLRSVVRSASGRSSRSNMAMKVIGRALSVEHVVEELDLGILEHRDLARHRDLDRALAALLQRVAVGLELLAARVAAGERAALVAEMLVEQRAGEAERARVHRLAEQRLDLRRLLGVRRARHRLLAHDVVAERRERREEGEVERGAAPGRGRHVLGEALPVPGDAGGEHLERDRLDVDEVAHRDLARLRAAGRDADAAVAHDHRGHAVPGGGRQRAVPADLRVVVRVRVDEAGGDDQVGRVDDPAGGALRELADRRDLSVRDRDVGVARRRAGAVDQLAVLDEEVVGHGRPVYRTPAIRVGA